MIKCPKCQSDQVAKTYIKTVYQTVGVNDGKVYEICEGSTKVDPEQQEFYCGDCFHEWDRWEKEPDITKDVCDMCGDDLEPNWFCDVEDGEKHFCADCFNEYMGEE